MSLRALSGSLRINSQPLSYQYADTSDGRGGRPSAFDRLLATRMGVKAVDALLAGQTDVMVGLQGREVLPVPLEKVVSRQREANLEYFEMAKMLAF